MKKISIVFALFAFFTSLSPNLQAFAEDKSYTLTPVQQAGENTITKYEYNEATKTLEPKYYKVNLVKTEYGNKNGADTIKYFVFTKDSNGNNTLTEGTADNHDIVWYGDSNRFSGRIADNQNGAAIDKDFVELNTANQDGAAIYNDEGSAIGDITGDFIGNSGRAIYNYDGTIGDITGDFIGNSGEAIYNQYGTIGNITGDFIGNSGEAIYNDDGTIGDITGDFIGNSDTAICNNNYGTIGNITGDFIGNSGGVIFNLGEIGDITGDFIGNSGGVILNENGGKTTIGNITGNFIGNYASANSTDGSAKASGGAIHSYGAKNTIGNITGDFIGNYASAYSSNSRASAYGGAIYKDSKKINDISGSFINNYASANSTNGDSFALGGAIFTRYDMNFVADNKVNYFSGNYTEDSRGKIPNAIFVHIRDSRTITLKATNNGAIIFDDQIDGGKVDYSNYQIDRTNSYNLTLTGDESGKIVFNNDIINANITLENTNLYLGRENVFDQSQMLNLNSGSMSMVNNSVGMMHIPTLNLNGNVNISADVDLANKSMDRITADNYNVTDNAFLNVNYLNLLNDATEDNTSILFADTQIADNVKYTGSNTIAYSNIYKYDVSYNKDPEDNLGYFIFNRSVSSNPSDSFNPSVLPTPVVAQAGAYTTQTQTFNNVFHHSDNFMTIPNMERISIKNANKYALSPTGDATDVGTFSPLLTKQDHNGFWVKPYASFESIPLKNGPKVSNINYGTLIGYDSNLQELRHGFDRVLTGYVGYNGASQRYSGIDSYQNGGLLGSTVTLYKGNFFNATTISVGASSGSNTTYQGHEDFALLLAGIGNKTGYNFEFKDGKVILQPNFFISYTFVNTFDYTNAAGLRIKSDPLNAIQLSPGLKLIGNTKNGWQPYIGVNMVWNLLDKTKVTADDVRLPEMSIKPYVQYGAGIQKCFKEDKMTAFGQAMIHNGGRNGISLTFGLRWKLGK